MITEEQVSVKMASTPVEKDPPRDIPLDEAIEEVASRLYQESQVHKEDSGSLATWDFWNGYARGILEFQAALYKVQRMEMARQTRQLLKLSRACHAYYRK